MGWTAPKNIIVHHETARQAFLKLPYEMCEDLCNKVSVTEITGLADDNTPFYKGDVAPRLITEAKFASQSSKRSEEKPLLSSWLSLEDGQTNL